MAATGVGGVLGGATAFGATATVALERDADTVAQWADAAHTRQRIVVTAQRCAAPPFQSG